MRFPSIYLLLIKSWALSPNGKIERKGGGGQWRGRMLGTKDGELDSSFWAGSRGNWVEGNGLWCIAGQVDDLMLFPVLWLDKEKETPAILLRRKPVFAQPRNTRFPMQRKSITCALFSTCCSYILRFCSDFSLIIRRWGGKKSQPRTKQMSLVGALQNNCPRSSCSRGTFINQTVLPRERNYLSPAVLLSSAPVTLCFPACVPASWRTCAWLAKQTPPQPSFFFVFFFGGGGECSFRKCLKCLKCHRVLWF